MNKSKFAKFRKGAIAALCAVAVTCTGLAAACSDDGNNGDDGNTSSTPRKEDTQLLKNGNFEFANVPEDAVHLIKSVTNWSRSGDSSSVMSGIINTSVSAWDKMTDYELKDKLDANNDLSVGDSDYDELHVDYNGMDSDDILYIDPYAAALSDSDNIGDNEDGVANDSLIREGSGKQRQRSYREFLGIEVDGNEEDGFTYTFRGNPVYFDEDSGEYYMDEDFEHPVRYEVINNPETHLGTYEKIDGKHYLGDTEVLLDEDGNYYIDTNGNGEVDVLEDESVGNVLMIHNYPSKKAYNGIEQHYSSQSITLEANTAAEISLWVKTSDLKFDKGYLLNGDPVIGLDQQDKGAYIEVTQTVASSTIDSFKIKAINTEKILADNPELDTNNGWLQYTIYVKACNFANSTITINLGLGGSELDEKVTGYAFFDDVEVKKFIDFDAKNSDDELLSSYNDNEQYLKLGEEDASYCSLTSEAEDKIFYADKVTIPGNEDPRFSTRFHYYIDLASEEFTKDSLIAFDSDDLEVSTALTTSETSGKIYASAEKNDAYVNGPAKVDGEYLLPDSMKSEGGRPTFNDFIGIYGSKESFADDFDRNPTDESGKNQQFKDLSSRLDPLTGESGLAALEKFSGGESGSMLVTFSAFGAAYTTTIESGKLFTVAGTKSDEGTSYKILSFWVKTSDMKGSTAATIKIIDAADDDKYSIITVDSTNVKTNIGDEEDIYNGWVQCFFFVRNNTKEDMSFKLEFSFGNTDIENTTGNSYKYGWAAMANIQTLDVDEDVFDIVSEGTYSKILTFNEESAKSHTPFDEATRMSNVKNEVGTPSSYFGVNGGSSYVADKEPDDDYDSKNNHKNGITGLINRESFEDETFKDADLRNYILGSFVEGASKWSEVFGDDCYQPLIIIDSLREYYVRATTTKEYFEEHRDEFFVKNENGAFVEVAEDAEWDEDEIYYSKNQIINYGYIGNDATVSSGSYRVVSVKVMVSGNATAWVYLVDSSSYDVMSFDIPEYTYYYDDKGNVLSDEYDDEWTDAEYREAIVYTLRDDGLYKGKDGGVYANLSNLTKKFHDYKFERNLFFTEDGENISYDKLEDGVTYYNEDGEIANHYLCVGSQKVYEYDAGHYYYLVNGKRATEVEDFDHDYARYNANERVAPEYAVEVPNTNGEWVTVNFIIHTGNEDKQYRLELWSGERGETGYTEGMTSDDVDGKGAVAFDYSAGLTESNAPSVISLYETKIKNAYRNLIFDNDGADKLESDMNIEALEGILADLGVSEADRKAALVEAGLDADWFDAQYYTFSWYDSAQFIPFNRETAKAGQTGYSYTASSYSETLVYLKAYDYSDNSYNVYFDYSAVDQTISIDSTSESDNGSGSTSTDTDGESPWLLITSIVLVAVLLFVLLAIFARYLWKGYSKKRGQKQMQKNNYKQRERYIRKLGLQKTAPVEEDVAEAPAKETPSTEESPVEETPEEAPAEETPVEEVPVEEAPAEETSAEGENKDE